MAPDEADLYVPIRTVCANSSVLTNWVYQPASPRPFTFSLSDFSLGKVIVLLLSLLHLPVHTVSAQGPTPFSFQTIWSAEVNGWYRILQERRVYEPSSDPNAPGRWLVFHERLTTAPATNTSGYRFALELEDVLGAGYSKEELDLRRRLYLPHASFLHQYATFRIVDPDLAAIHYSIHFVENRIRRGRAVQRVAVVPTTLGRNPWVLEIDYRTGYPLYRAEYDAAGLLASTVDVLSIDDGVSSADSRVNWWQPRQPTTEFANLREALSSLPQAPFPLPATGTIPANYHFLKARVVRSDINAQVSLVLTYTDGIDTLFIVETLNAIVPTLPKPPPGTTTVPYAIFVYQDLNFSQLMFHHNGVQVTTIGKAGYGYARSVANSLLEIAVGGN